MPIDFNKHPYHDDFSLDDSYYRLLFQPGRAVQARELTQIQTLLQSQIQQLGTHLFKDGALVAGGQIDYDRTTTKWLAVQAQFEGSPVRIRQISPGMIITKPASTVTTGSHTGTIVGVREAEGNDPNTILFKWTKGEPDDINRDGFLPGEILNISNKTTQVSRFRVRTLDQDGTGVASHYGTSSKLSVSPGVYFWKGTFVQSQGGSVTLSKYATDATYRIGFIVDESVVTDDPKTLDPASGSSNYSAPGADRYKITLKLVKIGDGITLNEDIAPDFLEIARVVNGNLQIADVSSSQSLYNILGKKLAQRTYEESGNYVAKRYNLQLKNKTTKDNPIISAHMNEGAAYVGGYRHSLNFNSSFDIKKGRDTITETLNINNTYGDNYLILYDRADTVNATNPENANGLFVIGSGAGSHLSSDLYGQRGAAVAIHSVPKDLVERYGLADQWKWGSTLIGTARPTQFVYDKEATDRRNSEGHCYDLYLGDFKSANVANVVSVDNKVALTSISSNTENAHFKFEAHTHGITTDDRISISGASIPEFNIDHYPVVFANTSSVEIDIGNLPQSQSFTDGGTLYRTTGNTSATRTVVLDQASSAAWNGSYIGGTIRVGNSTPKTIIDYIGTDSDATSNYSSQVDVGWAKAGTIIVNSDFEEIPTRGDAYTINMPMSQARSVVYNQNISATGADQYPAILNQSWNVDPVSGVLPAGFKPKMGSSVYQDRVDGDSTYNRLGNSPAGEDALLFDIGRGAVKSVVRHGSLDTGLFGNTQFYYTEYSKATGGGAATLAFAPATAGQYDFFDRPIPYPYSDRNVTDRDEIKKNFILVNQSSGQVLTNAITQVALSGYDMTLTSDVTFAGSTDYVLLYPVKAVDAKPAYKKKISANTIHSGKATLISLTDYANGHVQFEDGEYGNTAGSRFSLGKPDVFKIHKVVHEVRHDTASNINADIADAAKDITSSFTLDDGQRDSFYDNSALVLKADAHAPTGNVLVIFDRFQRVDNPKSGTQTETLDSPGFFAVDSYQYTTDLTLNHASDQDPFTVGMEVRANNGVVGYVMEYANTSGTSKVRLQDVRGPIGTTDAKFVVGETIVGFANNKVSVAGEILSIVEADIKYSEIPQYKSAGGKIYNLRNAIDARPYVSTSDRVSDTISNSMTPFIPTASRMEAGRATTALPINTEVIADSFAGRMDKIVVTKTGDYRAEAGVPAFTKYPPADKPDDEALTLFTINIPPYTFDAKDVQVLENHALRHTMKDIGRLARRVENLEYYVSLNMLEKQMSELEVTDESGLSRFKNGIVVDDFNNDNLMSGDVDNSVSIGKGELRPKQDVLPYGDIGFSVHQQTGTKIYGDLDNLLDEAKTSSQRIMLNHTTEPMITQGVATIYESVNPFDVQSYVGELKMTPSQDHWFDTTKVPENSALLDDVFSIITELDENSSAAEITQAILTMDDFWNEISGGSALGDDITGPAIHFEDPNTSAAIERNIQLGSTVGGRSSYWNAAELDAAIASHGMTDGMTRNFRILPYMRSRDVIIRGSGLKPNHIAGIQFDGVGLENYFSRANEIYIKYDPRADTPLHPDVNGKYEKIRVSAASGGGKTANAILLAVREPSWKDDPFLASSTSRYMVGYIVPEFDDETGLVDYVSYKDGYYSSSWSDAEIRSQGFQGSSGTHEIYGYVSEQTYKLIGSGTSADYYNGHYTGTARNSTSNTTHIILSPDAHRYIDKNFRKSATSATNKSSGYPESVYINIVSGAGAGQQVIANGIVDGVGSAPVVELRSPVLTTAIDSSSVYSLSMKSVNPNDDRYEVSQIGDLPAKTNDYGEKMGMLRLPSTDRVKFTTGRKLVEIMDRYSRQEWEVSSYASGYYEAAGSAHDEISADLTPDRLNLLKEIRSKVGAFRVMGHPDDLDYIPARNAGQDEYGKLAVVTGIDVANGAWTAKETDGIEFERGSAEFGTIVVADQNHLQDQLTGIWREIRDNYPDVYEKYYRGYVDTWLVGDDTPEQED